MSKTNRAAELLAENVKRIMDSDEYKAALSFRAKLPHYSFRNVLLLYLQNPDVSMVAGYNMWKSQGRQVKKGEKSLAIFAPMTRKNSDGERELFGFKTASVFDIAQTEGDEVPQLPAPKLLTGSSRDITQAIRTLEQHMKLQGYSVEQGYTGSANGLIYLDKKAILIKEGLEPAQYLKTLIHEYTHGLMHADAPQDADRSVWELEAESCAYIVCDTLGLDTAEYSFNYLAGWANAPEDVLPAAQKACRTARPNPRGVRTARASLSRLILLRLHR